MTKEQQTKDDGITKEDIMCHVIKQAKAVKRHLNDCCTRQLPPLTEPLDTFFYKSAASKSNKINRINVMSETFSNILQQSTGSEDIGTRISELYRLIN